MAPLFHALTDLDGDFQLRLCITAQHREMLDPVLQLFDIKPNHDLNVMRHKQPLAVTTGAMLRGLSKVLMHEKPHLTLVHGDTATTLAGALASFYQQVPLAHVEAGLRSGSFAAPFPEEMQRLLTSRLTRWHFAPTPLAQQNLLREGVLAEDILVTGNTVIDALLWVVKKIEAENTLRLKLETILEKAGYSSQRLKTRRLVLVTGHRRENMGGGFEQICEALRQLSSEQEAIDVVYPVHLNPQVREPVMQILGAEKNIFLLPPLDYAPFVYLMSQATLLLTDSGGIQEEAPSLGKPVLVMREVTERPEALAAGTAQLVGTNVAAIVSAAGNLLQDETMGSPRKQLKNPYGDGQAAARIATFLQQRLQIDQSSK